MLIVDFDHRHHYLVGQIRICVGADSLENLFARDGHDALVGTVAHHGVALASSRLTIGKQAAVVPFPRAVQNASTKRVENKLLISVPASGPCVAVALSIHLEAIVTPEGSIERELLWLLVLPGFCYLWRNLQDCSRAIHFDAELRIQCTLSIVEGSDANPNCH